MRGIDMGGWDEFKDKFVLLDIAPADAAFIAFGDNVNEVFENAALAMFEIMVATRDVRPDRKVDVEMDAPDLKALMFGWLNELNFIVGSQNMVFSKFEVKIKEGAEEGTLRLDAKAWGEEMNRERHDLRSEVKSATYHKLFVEKNEKKGRWEAQVVIDL